jgi:hypothetical protein
LSSTTISTGGILPFSTLLRKSEKQQAENTVFAALLNGGNLLSEYWKK